MPTRRIEAAAPTPAALQITATAPVEIQAAGGEGKRPTFSIVGYTGAVMSVGGFYSQVILDLTGLKAAGQEIPALRSHDHDRIVGQTDAVRIDAEGVRLTGTITGDNTDAAEITSQAKNGFRWRASIGASVERREFLDPGKTTTVNGREVTGPLVIAREATLQEISFVAIGADGQTSATVAASIPPGTHNGVHSMNFEAWLQAKGFDPAALSDGQKTILKAAYDAEQAPPTPTPETPPTPTPEVKATQRLDEIIASARREEDRVAEITRITAQAIQDRPMLIDELERLSRAAIEAKTAPLEYELIVLRATRAPAGPGILVRGGDRKASARAIEAALCLAGGLEKPEKHFDEATLNAAADRFPSGIGLCDLLLMAARENGYTGHSARDVRGLLQSAFGVQASGGFSTISLPGILGATANKFLATGFNAVENSWREIAAIRSVQDFKTITSYSLTGGAMYEKVGPGGELKHATLGELSYTNKAETYGRMFAITRQDIINDDLGALTDVPRKLGRGAALKLNDVFWVEFLDNATFFAAGNSNYQSGVTVGTNDSRLNTEGLTRGETLFLNQTDPDGYPVAITPRVLLVPNALSVTANQLMVSTELRDTTASTNYMTSNPHAGKFRVVRSSYLGNSSYTGYSVAAWYLLADPMDLAVVEVAFLNGRDVPVVESADADFNTLGVQMRGYHDFGVAKQEYRAGIKSKGAA